MLSLMEVYSMTDLRALITQLCDELDHNRRCLLDDRRLTHPLSDKARAALVETDGPAVSGDREPASVAKQCSGELSPAAQAVVDAADIGFATFNDRYAAALRAAADQAEDVCPARPSTEWGEGWLEGVKDVVAGFRRIAAELETQ